MNTSRFSLVAALLACTQTACNSCASSTPSPSAIEDETVDWGRWLSLAVTPEGNPAALSYDADQDAVVYGEASIAEDGTLVWTVENVDGHVVDNADLGKRGKYTSLAIADDGTRWAAYYDAGAKNLRVARRILGSNPWVDASMLPDGTPWSSMMADGGTGVSPDAGQHASLSLDADNNPVVAHYDAGAGALRISHWNGTAFDSETVDAGEDFTKDTGSEAIDANVGKFATLLIHQGVEHIAYLDVAAGALKLAIGTKGSYNIEVVDPEAGAWPDIAVDDGGNFIIAYQDEANQHLRVATGRSGAWDIEVVDTSPYVGADTEVYFDAGEPRVLYFDGTNNNLKRAERASGTWSTATMGDGVGALGFHNESIVIDGIVYGASYNFTNKSVWFKALN